MPAEMGLLTKLLMALLMLVHDRAAPLANNEVQQCAARYGAHRAKRLYKATTTSTTTNATAVIHACRRRLGKSRSSSSLISISNVGLNAAAVSAASGDVSRLAAPLSSFFLPPG